MKRILLIAVSVLVFFQAEAQNPVAAPEAQVVAGNARFTVLTDRLIRMEWSPEGFFEDHATLAIVNRNLPVPSFSAKPQGDGAPTMTVIVNLSTGRAVCEDCWDEFFIVDWLPFAADVYPFVTGFEEQLQATAIALPAVLR